MRAEVGAKMPTALATKKAILDDAGYAYSFDREIYFSRKDKKAFSVEFIEDHAPEVLEKSIQEPSNTGGWRFYFNTPPAESVRLELESVLSGQPVG
jgi:hypothetical protein